MKDAKSLEEVTRLVDRLKVAFQIGDENKPEGTPFRYAVYVRKSTDRSEKQERSIPDQIHACRRIASSLGLRCETIIHEEKSAKISDNRPKFRILLNEIMQGRYDGIITWSPDRLARNMKEAGEIIDMLDKGVIRDIKFANGHTFNNEPSGKMLLGIAFVMAKQYSDQHSQNIKRAVSRITAEGKVFDRAKHGYYKDKHGYPQPDGENWYLLKNAFSMRINEKLPLDDIAKWLTAQGYPLNTEHNTRRPIVINRTFLSDLFRDPYYAGALIHGDQIINLVDKANFQPMLTVEEFDNLARENGLKKRFTLSEVIRPKGSVKADFLRGVVTCGSCNRIMSTGLTSKKMGNGEKVSYFYFRCDSPDCKYFSKSVRGKVILSAVKEFLASHTMNFEKGYAAYVREMHRIIEKRDKEIDREIKSFNQRMTHTRKDVLDSKELIKKENDTLLKSEYRKDLKEQLKQLEGFEGMLKELREEKTRQFEVVKTFEEFLELFQNLAKYIEKLTSMADLDDTIKKLFSNFVVEGKKVTQIKQNSPFGELYDTSVSAMVDPAGLEPATPWLQTRCSTK